MKNKGYNITVNSRIASLNCLQTAAFIGHLLRILRGFLQCDHLRIFVAFAFHCLFSAAQMNWHIVNTAALWKRDGLRWDELVQLLEELLTDDDAQCLEIQDVFVDALDSGLSEIQMTTVSSCKQHSVSWSQGHSSGFNLKTQTTNADSWCGLSQLEKF